GGRGEAGALDQPVVLAAGDANLSIRPERVDQKSAVVGEERLHRRRVAIDRRPRDKARARELVSGPIRQPAAVGGAFVFTVEELPDAVALATDFRGSIRHQ